ncbi:MAG: dihydropteroate synthase [Thermoproteota archaeon]|nr:dihydropteroate synthase [Thermoproteota archaeon]
MGELPTDLKALKNDALFVYVLVLVKNVQITGRGHVKIMGILNASPESFYAKSIAIDSESISQRAKELELEGADIIDIGTMSTAPYLDTMIPAKVEGERMRMAMKAVKEATNLPVSIDTQRAEIAKLSIDLGADLINDVTGLVHDKKMADVVSQSGLPIIISAFSNGHPGCNFGNIRETIGLLKKSINIAHLKKISDDNIIVDPSIGFFRKDGTNPFFTKIMKCEWYERDLDIISHLEKLDVLSRPVCISVSNKSFIGHVLHLNRDERIIPSVIFELLCFLKGATIIRTHNVKEIKLALRTLMALPSSTIDKMKYYSF